MQFVLRQHAVCLQLMMMPAIEDMHSTGTDDEDVDKQMAAT